MTRSAASARAATLEQEEGLTALYGEQATQSVSSSPVGITMVDAPKSPRSVVVLDAGDINMDALLIPEQRLPFQFLVKRVTDIIASSTALMIGLAPLLLIAALLKLEDPEAPVFRRRATVGMGEHVFHTLVFRGPTHMNRLPWIQGAIDTLGMSIFCSLLHVFVGDLSFVGPRPVSVKEAELFLPTQQHRFHVLPGIMGIEQLTSVGEAPLSIRNVATLDEQYVKEWSLQLDMAILGRYWSRLMATKVF